MDYPEGPIIVKRWDPTKGQTAATVGESSISTQMIWRIANAFREGLPINFDRVLGASYNTRSVLEALVAHTPEFYVTLPGRVELRNSTTTIKPGHKHVVWLPNQPHEMGRVVVKDLNVVISEVPGNDVVYEALVLADQEYEIDVDIRRRHAQIQVALILIGQQLGFKTYVAKNDQGIVYNNRRLAEMESVLPSIGDHALFAGWQEAAEAAKLIDCVWFKNSRLMPAVMEIEHTTGVTSGLARMKNLQDMLPPFPTRYVIVAPDEDRDKVFSEANRPQFRPLQTRYFPYSAVEELYSLCQRRKLRGVTEEFLDCFMEPTQEPMEPVPA